MHAGIVRMTPAVNPDRWSRLMPSVQPEPLPADVIAAIERGEKIEAIKLLRQHLGMSLAEAKDAVDARYAEHSSRPRRTAAGKEGGLKRVMMFVVIGPALLLLIYWFLRLPDN
jgi:hypothetical protein